MSPSWRYFELKEPRIRKESLQQMAYIAEKKAIENIMPCGRLGSPDRHCTAEYSEHAIKRGEQTGIIVALTTPQGASA